MKSVKWNVLGILGFALATVLSSGAFANQGTGTLVAQCSSTGTVSLRSYFITYLRVRFSQQPRGNAFYVVTAHNGTSQTSYPIDEADVTAKQNADGNLVELTGKLSRQVQLNLKVAGRTSIFQFNLAQGDARGPSMNTGANTRGYACTWNQ
ncbi:MAG: hypothetical protein ABL958_04830 [Bdellovibrionia bacterium]